MTAHSDLFSLRGRTAVVTGASRGIGRAISIAFAEAGASVLLIGRDAEALQGTAHSIGAGVAAALELDVADEHAPQLALEAAIKQFGSADILVNNAGIIRRSPAAEHTRSDWDEVIATDLTSVFAWSQTFGRQMLAQQRGKIINIASLLSFQGGLNIPAYAAAKGGVAQLTKALSNEWARHGVNVNAIAPGYIRTNATEALRANEARSTQVFSRIPAGRWGEPEDIAGAAVFLASKASDYVHGHILAVDGGWLAY